MAGMPAVARVVRRADTSRPPRRQAPQQCGKALASSERPWGLAWVLRSSRSHAAAAAIGTVAHSAAGLLDEGPVLMACGEAQRHEEAAVF